MDVIVEIGIFLVIRFSKKLKLTLELIDKTRKRNCYFPTPSYCRWRQQQKWQAYLPLITKIIYKLKEKVTILCEKTISVKQEITKIL